MKKAFLYFSLIIPIAIGINFSLLSAQSKKIDSLHHVLKAEKEDTNKVNTLNNLAFSLASIKPDSAVLLAQQASTLAVKLGMTDGEANAYRNMGLGYNEQGDYQKAIEYDLKALNIYRKIGDKQGQVSALSSLGVVYYNQGDYPKAIDNDKEAFSIGEELGNKQVQASALGNIGIVYYGQGDYPKALDYYLKALKIKEELGNKRGQANTLGNIGIVYDDQGDYAKALAYYQRALKMDEELGNKNGQAADLSNIGLVCNELGDHNKALDYYLQALKLNEELEFKQGQAYSLGNIGDIFLEAAIAPGTTHKASDSAYNKALGYYTRALKIAEDIGDKRGIASHMGSIGILYTRTGKYKQAETYLKKAIVLDSSIGEQNYLKDNETNLSKLYEATGQYKPAVNYFKKAMALKDTLFNIDKNKALTSKELTYQFEKKEAAEKAEQDKKDAVALADKRKQRITVYAVLGGMALTLVFVGFILRSLRITRRQKQDIEVKNRVIEEKQKDILDSITYAKRLQDAILPSLSSIKKYLPESFLLYKPKDIIAGDFYWMHNLPLPEGDGRGEVILIAAADCTGHGVPGAMVSVVCSNALNRTVKEFKITEPGKILDKVRELVLETFEKSQDNVQDGMDISLCCINTKTSEVQWAGAYNSLWYIPSPKAEGQSEVIEVPADKQPIGKVDKPLPFNTHNLSITKDSILYLFTDGYADQFGGPKGKKFRYQQLQELLLNNAAKPMDEQRKILETTLEKWKGALEQVDDILIIGIRV